MTATLFTISAEEIRAAEQRGNHANRARLLAALEGDPTQWEYTGQCADLGRAIGKCACGHPSIRFEFILRHKTKANTVIVGSTCIDTFEGCNAEMVDAIRKDAERLEAEAAERKKRAREIAQDADIQTALDDLDRKLWELTERLAGAVTSYTYRDYSGNEHTGYRPTRRVRIELWRARWTPDLAAQMLAERQPAERHPRNRWKPYKSRAAWLKAIRAEIAWIDRLGTIWE